ncbi:MAG: pyrophosphatase [Parvibaculum sp.]|nr:pyrophosphatase [Parvibaculum sp.]
MKALADLAARFEKASISYAEGNGITRNDDWFILKMQEELGELTQVWMKLTERGRKRGRSDEDLSHDLADETADLLGHILLFAHRHQIDLAPAITRKWRFDPTGD